MNNSGMYELSSNELQQVNGGFGWAPIVIGVTFLAGVLKGCSEEKRDAENGE